YDDPTVKSVYVAFAKRLANQQNRFIQIAVPNYTLADDPTVISVSNGVVLSNGTVIDAVKATAWVAGATAGANANQSLTHTAYDDAVAVHGRLNDSQITKALLNGEFLFELHNGKVVVEQDTNTFTSFNPDKRKHFSKNRVVRTINGIKKDW
ncbi:phage tail sheath subtilisin-like domain-containing protein, partial [Brevibacillus laterosporus]